MKLASVAVSQPSPSATPAVTRRVATKSGVRASNVSTGEASERTDTAHRSAEATANMTPALGRSAEAKKEQSAIGP